MTDSELKMQIALGLMTSSKINPFLIWSVTDEELLDTLAKIFYSDLLDAFANEISVRYVEITNQAEVIHINFLNNPHTSNKTRIYINGVVNEITKRYKSMWEMP